MKIMAGNLDVKDLVGKWIFEYVYKLIWDEFSALGNVPTEDGDVKSLFEDRDLIQGVFDLIQGSQKENDNLINTQLSLAWLMCVLESGDEYKTRYAEESQACTPLEEVLHKLPEMKELLGVSEKVANELKSRLMEQAVFVCCEAGDFRTADKVYKRIWEDDLLLNKAQKKVQKRVKEVLQSKEVDHIVLKENSYMEFLRFVSEKILSKVNNAMETPFLTKMAEKELGDFNSLDDSENVFPIIEAPNKSHIRDEAHVNGNRMDNRLKSSNIDNQSLPGELCVKLDGRLCKNLLQRLSGDKAAHPDKYLDIDITKKLENIRRQRDEYTFKMSKFFQDKNIPPDIQVFDSPRPGPSGEGNVPREKLTEISPIRKSPRLTSPRSKKRRQSSSTMSVESVESPSKKRKRSQSCSSDSGESVKSPSRDKTSGIRDHQLRRNIGRNDRHKSLQKDSPKERVPNGAQDSDSDSKDEDFLRPQPPLPPRHKLRKSLAPAETKRTVRPQHDNSSLYGTMRVKWTKRDEEVFYACVKQLGVGNWASIRDTGEFVTRTNVNLKDKWRQMLRSGRAKELADITGDDLSQF